MFFLNRIVYGNYTFILSCVTDKIRNECLFNEEEIALEKENEDDCKKTSNYQNLMKYSKRMRVHRKYGSFLAKYRVIFEENKNKIIERSKNIELFIECKKVVIR
jgi:hypothetical protein